MVQAFVSVHKNPLIDLVPFKAIQIYINFSDQNWWFGEIQRRSGVVHKGLFPANYVTVTDQVKQKYKICVPTGLVSNYGKIWLSRSF